MPDTAIKTVSASPTAHNIAFGSTIKTLSDDGNHIGGYLITFTDDNNRDLDNEYFTKSTDLGTPHQLDSLPLLFHHGLDKRLKDIPIGRIVKAQKDDHGLWVEAILNEREQYEKFVAQWYADKDSPLDVESYEKAIGFIKSLIHAGKLGYSSGANPNTAQVNKDGHIDKWAVFEASGTHTPAEPSLTKLHTLKSIIDMFPDHTHIEPEMITQDHKEVSESTGNTSRDLSNTKTNNTKEDSQMNEQDTKSFKMTDDEMDEIVKRVVDKIRQSKMEDVDNEDIDKMEDELKKSASEKVDRETVDAKAYLDTVLEALPTVVQKAIDAKAQIDSQINNAVDKSLQGLYGKSKVGSGSHTEKTPHISVSEDLRYAHLSAEELQANYMLLKAFNPNAKVPGKKSMGTFANDETFLRHLVHKSVKAEDKFNTYEDVVAVKSARPFKADEINASDIAGQGDEWVGVHYSTSLWEKARNRRIFEALRSKGMMEVEVPQGHESTWVLTEGADPTVFTRQQANDLDANNGTTRIETTVVPQGIGTGRIQLTPGELVTMVAITDIGVEDILIPMLPQVNRQLQTTMLETLDKLALNADSATGSNTNINLIDGTPSSTITSKPYYLATNGFLKYALVTGSGTSRDGGTLDENDYRLTYKLMPSAIREDKDNLVFIIDSDTHDASLDIAAIKTDDVRRTNATVTSGVIQNIYGIDVVRSGFMGLANSAGKISGTPSNNTLGRILCVYPRYWALGWKRQITFEQARDIYSASNLVAVSMRMGMIARGAGASTVSYNLTV
jgi:hypothetical protein